MKLFLRKIVAATIATTAIGAVLLPTAAHAGSIAIPISLSATVSPSCSVSSGVSPYTSAVTYTPTSALASTSIGTVTVTCQNADPVTVSWSALAGGTSTYASSALTLSKLPLVDLSTNQNLSTSAYGTLTAALTTGEKIGTTSSSSFTFQNTGATSPTSQISVALQLTADSADNFVKSGDTIAFQSNPVLAINY